MSVREDGRVPSGNHSAPTGRCVKQWFMISEGPHYLTNIFSEVDEVKVVGVIASTQSYGGDEWLMKQW